VKLHNKVQSYAIRKTLNAEPHLWIKRSQRVGSAMCTECSTKDWRHKSCWLHAREKSLEVIREPGGVTTYLTLLGPALIWN